MRCGTICLLPALWLAAGCHARRGEDGSALVDEAAPRLRVRVVKAKKEKRSGTRVLPGVMLPWQEAKLGARVAGELVSISVDRGDRVKKGQILATIAIPGLAEDVQRAGAHRRSASAELGMLEDQRARMAKAVASGPKGVIAEGEISALDAKIEAAHARIAAAAADQGHGSAMLADTTVVAPFDGIALARRADAGAALTAGSIVVEVADVATLRLAIDVPERDAGGIKLGQAVTVTIPALADRQVTAAVARFAPALDGATRTLRVEIDVPNADGSVLSGLAARAAIDLGTRAEVFSLPAEAVAQDQGQASVWVADSGVAKRKKITIAYDAGPTVDVAAGIDGGEEIIVGGRGLVGDGIPIEVAR